MWKDIESKRDVEKSYPNSQHEAMNVQTRHRFTISAAAAILLFFALQQIFLGTSHLTPFVIALEVMDAFLLLFAASLLDSRTTLLRQLKIYSNNLEDITQQLLSKSTQLEEALLIKRRLLRIINHDIRSPLGSIVLASDALLRRTSDGRCRDLSLNINKSAYRITEMVNRYLQDVSHAPALPEPALEDINIQALLDLIVSSHQFSAAKKNITVNLFCDPDMPTIRSDRTSLLQIYDNLLSNAIKFSSHGTTVTVQLSRTDSEVVTEIEDQGPGLTDEDQRVLFIAFAKRSAQPTGGETSTGVGLSIVKALVDACGARISVRSQLNRGTVFTIRFSTKQAAEDKLVRRENRNDTHASGEHLVQDTSALKGVDLCS